MRRATLDREASEADESAFPGLINQDSCQAHESSFPWPNVRAKREPAPAVGAPLERGVGQHIAAGTLNQTLANVHAAMLAVAVKLEAGSGEQAQRTIVIFSIAGHFWLGHGLRDAEALSL